MDDFVCYVIKKTLSASLPTRNIERPVFFVGEKTWIVTLSLQEDPDSRIVGGKKDYEEGLQGFGGFHLFGDMAIMGSENHGRFRCTRGARTVLLRIFLARYTSLILIFTVCLKKNQWKPMGFSESSYESFYESFPL